MENPTFKQIVKGVVHLSAEEQDSWTPIEETPFLHVDLQVINVDTRDFHCGWMLEDTRAIKRSINKISKPQHRDDFFYTSTELMQLLLELRERSGGKVEWRMLSFTQNKKYIGGDWRFKYLRFYKSEHGWYCENENKLIEKRILKLPIESKYLGAH
jgi:hypothetical protein